MSTPIRALVVDDEPLARRRILDLLEQEPDVTVLGECADGEEAVERIAAEQPDVVFLDVQMPEMTGFDVVEAIGSDAMPAVVFVTAYDEYALRAFDAHALDYLMKPFHRARFGRAMERVREQVSARRGGGHDEMAGEHLRRLLDELRPRRYARRLVVRIGSRILFVNSADVDWIDADGNYARLHVGAHTYLLRETMSHLEERLDPERFLRIHRSTIVNLERIREVQPLFKGNYVVILQDGTRLSTTRGYRERLQALIDGRV
ncbi:MAG TPA: LytTR family transcriptional regulator DNA-binding domain-containing protein [Longimicrobiaceae bacterium]|nr:LytTR family transcriptional regulator DNA-binding domain-containing protein [Longimicrobiaceae bacterium]